MLTHLMKLIDGIKEQGKPFKIPLCSRDELPNLLKELGFTTGAEIGVYRGEFTEKFCEEGLKIYAIDPWMGYYGAGRTEQQQDKQDVNFKEAQKKLSEYENCTLIRKTSFEALSDFEDNSLDFVYIDGDHRFPYIAQDIYEWYQKVKPGGVVSGHDYFCTHPGANNVICQVSPVVDAFVETYQIENFYTFGRTKENVQDEKKGDQTLSWMFFKP